MLTLHYCSFFIILLFLAQTLVNFVDISYTGSVYLSLVELFFLIFDNFTLIS